MGPGQRIAHGLLARRQISIAASQHGQPLIQSRQECRRREDLDPGRGQFDSQWQAVYPAANLSDRVGILGREVNVPIHGLRSREEQLHCLRSHHRFTLG
jgi:hypothetical protein